MITITITVSDYEKTRDYVIMIMITIIITPSIGQTPEQRESMWMCTTLKKRQSVIMRFKIYI